MFQRKCLKKLSFDVPLKIGGTLHDSKNIFVSSLLCSFFFLWDLKGYTFSTFGTHLLFFQRCKRNLYHHETFLLQQRSSSIRWITKMNPAVQEVRGELALSFFRLLCSSSFRFSSWNFSNHDELCETAVWS